MTTPLVTKYLPVSSCPINTRDTWESVGLSVTISNSGRFRVYGNLRGQILKDYNVGSPSHTIVVQATPFVDGVIVYDLVANQDLTVSVVTSKTGEWSINSISINWPIEIPESDDPGSDEHQLDIRFSVMCSPSDRPLGHDWIGLASDPYGRTWIDIVEIGTPDNWGI